VATDQQTAANRLNAQKSTGPKTPEGRAAVRLNGVKHGLTAETIVLKGENQADYTNLLDSLEAEHDPVTPTEEALVVQLGMATWRLRRLYHVEAGFYAYKMKDTADYSKSQKLDDSERLGLIADWGKDTLGMFNRQEARLERTFYRALHELQRLRKERESNLALVSQAAPEASTPQPQASARGNINDIQPPPDPEIPEPSPETIKNPAPPDPPTAAPSNL
jgi:hypothetical protein